MKRQIKILNSSNDPDDSAVEPDTLYQSKDYNLTNDESILNEQPE